MKHLRPRSLKKRLRPRLLAVYALALALIWLARPTPWSLLIGCVPVLVGEWLRIWATGHLHKTDELTVTGAYGYLRHPLYAGTLLIATGFAIIAASAPALFVYGVLLLGYFGYYMPYKDRIEGARLESRYGDAYRRYAAAVPRLVPRLHPYRPLVDGPEERATWRKLRFADNHELGTAVGVGLGLLVMVGRYLLL